MIQMTIFIMFLLLTTLLVRRNTSTRKADYIILDRIDIQNMYPLDGKGRDWFHCLAYHYIPKYSESNNSWKYHIKGDNLYAVWAVRNNAKQIEYSWGGFDYEKEHIREFPYACNFVMDIDGIIQLYNEGGIVPDRETFLGEFYIGRYSEEHHGNHNSFHEYLINNNKKLII